jgi:hypothetical protein
MGPAQNGTQTAALCATGTEGPPWPAILTSVEEYDGSSWSEVNNNTTGRESGVWSWNSNSRISCLEDHLHSVCNRRIRWH